MALEPTIDRLGHLLGQLQHGRCEALELGRALDGLAAAAADAGLGDLARSCRVAATALAADGDAPGGAAVGDHLRQLHEFATRCAAARAVGGDAAAFVPPPLLVLPDATARRRHAEALASFDVAARASLAALDQALAAGADGADAAVLARELHRLEAGLAAAASPAVGLCQLGRLAVAAGVEAGTPLPFDLFHRLVGQLRATLAPAGAGGSAPRDSALLPDLVAAVAGAMPKTAGDEALPLQVGGPFAAELAPLVAAAAAGVLEADAALAALVIQPDGMARVDRARRGFRSVRGALELVDLELPVALAQASADLLAAHRALGAALAPGAVDLLRAAAAMLAKVVAALQGDVAPRRREVRWLLARLVAAAADPLGAATPVMASTRP